MKEPYLEVTFRHGRPIAAYLYLPREIGEKSYRTSKAEPGMVVDFGQSGNPIGIEITAPTKITVADRSLVAATDIKWRSHSFAEAALVKRVRRICVCRLI